MGKFIALEDVVDDTIMAVNNENSINPAIMIQVADYKEELEKLKKTNGQDTVDDGAVVDPPADDTSADGAEGDDEPSGDSGEEDDAAGATEPSMENLNMAFEGLNAAFAINRIAIKLRQQNKRGGTTPQGAAMAFEMTNQLARTVGHPGLGKQSTIGFESYSSRMRSTELAIESISDVAKDIWNAIKQFFRSVWNWMKEYLFGMKQTAKVQDDQYKEINEVFNQLDKKLQEKDALIDELKIKKIRDKRYRARAQYLIVNAEGTSGDVVATGEGFEKFLYGYAMMVEHLLKTKFLPCVIELAKNEPDAGAAKIRLSDGDFGGMGLQIGRDQTSRQAVRSGMTVMHSEMLPANKQLVVVAPRDGDNKAIEDLSGFTTVDLVDGAQGRRGSAQVEVEADKAELQKVMDIAKACKLKKDAIMKMMDDKYKQIKLKTESFLAADMRSWVNLEEDQIKVLQELTNDLLKLQMNTVERNAMKVLECGNSYVDAAYEYVSFSLSHISKVMGEASEQTA